MIKRMLLMLAAVVVLLAVLGFVKYRQIQTAIAQAGSFQMPPEAVTTIVARQETWEPTLDVVGTVTAVNGVLLSADLPGIVEKIEFQSGDSVRAGAVVVRLDTRQEQAQLAAAKARRDLAKTTRERLRGLVAKGVSSQSEWDAAAAAVDEAEGQVAEILAMIDRKTIRAPFAGRLGVRQVNLGQFLESGDPVAPLQSFDPIYVNFGIPQQQLRQVHVGGGVKVSDDGAPAVLRSGTITAVDSLVSEATRNVQVQATLANKDSALRPGMFVEVRVLLEEGMPVIPLPASAISYAPYGDSVFIVEHMKDPQGADYKGVRQQFVKLGASRGDQVAVIEGVPAGAEVVTSGPFKLRNGAAVLVNNSIQPANDPSPRPQDN